MQLLKKFNYQLKSEILLFLLNSLSLLFLIILFNVIQALQYCS